MARMEIYSDFFVGADVTEEVLHNFDGDRWRDVSEYVKHLNDHHSFGEEFCFHHRKYRFPGYDVVVLGVKLNFYRFVWKGIAAIPIGPIEQEKLMVTIQAGGMVEELGFDITDRVEIIQVVGAH